MRGKLNGKLRVGLEKMMKNYTLRSGGPGKTIPRDKSRKEVRSVFCFKTIAMRWESVWRRWENRRASRTIRCERKEEKGDTKAPDHLGEIGMRERTFSEKIILIILSKWKIFESVDDSTSNIIWFQWKDVHIVCLHLGVWMTTSQS